MENFNTEKKYEVNLNIDFTKLQGVINSEMQLNLYRILQEQLRNISKYANAKKVSVESSIENNNFIMQIIDDGIGFDFLSVKKGIGLANIRRRAELFSGRMDIISSHGKGCKIIITLPLISKKSII